MSINSFLATVKTRGLAKQSRYMVVMGILKELQQIEMSLSSQFGEGNLMSDYTKCKSSNGGFITSLYCEITSLQH